MNTSSISTIAKAAVLTSAIAGCTGKAAAPAVAAAPVYTIVDTAHTANKSDYGVLERDGIAIDTVDLAFGVQDVGRDSVLFIPVTSTTDSSGGARRIPSHLILFDGTSRTDVATIVPDYDEMYSAPSVIDGALLYWGIHHGASADSVRAVRYEFKRRRLNPLPTKATRDRNGGRFYFTPPFLEGKEIVFKSPTGEWRFRTPKQ